VEEADRGETALDARLKNRHQDLLCFGSPPGQSHLKVQGW